MNSNAQQRERGEGVFWSEMKQEFELGGGIYDLNWRAKLVFPTMNWRGGANAAATHEQLRHGRTLSRTFSPPIQTPAKLPMKLLSILATMSPHSALHLIARQLPLTRFDGWASGVVGTVHSYDCIRLYENDMLVCPSIRRVSSLLAQP